MKLLLLAAASLAVVSCASLSLADLEFHAWKLKFAKSYSSAKEEARRKDIWLSTRRTVLAHNILADQGIKTYRMGMNQFSDMDSEEFSQTFLTKMVPSNKTKPMPHQGKEPSTPKGGAKKCPDFLDWRDKGCVTPVMDQGPCKADWAFSTTGALESQWCSQHGWLRSLSEQQLIDCSRSYGTHGCNGGLVDDAIVYIVFNDGINMEDSYPYEAKEGPCRFNSSEFVVLCNSFYQVESDEDVVQDYIIGRGPLSVHVDARFMQNYESGIFNERKCSSTELNQFMVIVGFGIEEDQEYWIVKNSWGTGWGEDGYIRMSRGKNNQCGIVSHVIFPIPTA